MSTIVGYGEPIVYWDRAAKKTEKEAIYGEELVRWLYETAPGAWLTEHIFAKPLFSKIYGAYQSSPLSGHKVSAFVQKFGIPMQEFEGKNFASFNDFFIRKFKPGARPFTQKPGELAAFAEARYLAFEKIREDQVFPVKGAGLSAELLLGSAEKAKPFIGGPLLLARLCPVDYHRFHYPDEGETLDHYQISGALHSVNPLALKFKYDILVTNERQVSLLKTDHLGLLACVEVGALCVGRIVQTHGHADGQVHGQTHERTHPRKRFARGDEKGYFLFGGSTVIVLGEPGAWRPDADLLEQTANNRETLVRLGERVAAKF